MTFVVETELVKIQRRQYYRLECLIDFELRKLLEDEYELFINNSDKINTEGTFIKATAVDISGGGIRFVSYESFGNKDKLLMLLEIVVDEKKYDFKLLGSIKNSIIIDESIKIYETRVQFMNLLKKERELIIKYIFEQERLQRKRIKE